MGQNNAEAILRAHLSKFGCEVELGIALTTFKQDENHVTATLVKSVDGHEQTEQIEVDWLIGADGARGTLPSTRNLRYYPDCNFPGVTRKALGLTFLGETRQEQHMVIGDMHIKGLSTAVGHLLETRLPCKLTSFLNRRPGTAGEIGKAKCRPPLSN